jgi:hypothetical protein
MATVASLLFKIAGYLRPVYYGTTTAAGTTTTLVDTTRTESNDYFNGGTIFFLSGALAGGTAVPSDYVQATGTFTIPTQSAAPGSGAAYAVVDKKYRREALVAALNMAILQLGPWPQIDESLTVVEGQERYTLPAGVYNVVRVLIATRAASPYEWTGPHRHWRERDGYLYFDDGYLPETENMPIRLYYEAPHARVSADADDVTDEANAELVAVMAAILAAQVRAKLAGQSDGEPRQTIEELTPLFQTLRAQHTTRRMRKDARYPSSLPKQERW